ncbi:MULTISPECIES: OFA family MFS transporter [unclassified Paenibacillus]|uniref:L-lactate MFS transporter n=1 Tax=unclassified Paenibacillus TaxID=185978 RepID=UPI002406AF55|nr:MULTISPECIES: OFA family MFS transporter [unclassified Paenibacillus]MDF9840910.1 OFA family oxalate/formate antiporter-like MFS transporter [Paenibacillus sp. PastF-2]MDF9847494.1 OFA family oxalate/formate antiporter-like MFS transporter [Paenibacillus sp. PastM-2]MDF9853929.1 OFA family oxalate/formate antiporter-like MFS transporter [Paenibacillus sp. PastF-1]MDH6479201.1 OFA family oxalate/formate antiporter-like MFS transporter [Paenibacillus sp. PastH-2]MDH6507063.1 OFA family oxalat
MTKAMPGNKKWLIVLGTVIMQMGLGTIYTWSLFNAQLVSKFGWELSSVSITFSITSFALAFATLFAGKLQDRFGLRRLTAAAGIMLGLGLILSSQASSLPMFYLLAGVVVGYADGTAYITSLSNLIKWFPKNKGLISGVSVGAYGTGSLIFKYINGSLIESQGVSGAFLYWGIIVMIMIVIGSMLVREAPAAAPAGTKAVSGRSAAAGGAVIPAKDYTVKEMLRTKEAYLLFVIFFTACMSGLYLIGIVKDIGVTLAGLDVAAAANAVAMIAIFNTAGRLILGALSDRMSRLKLLSITLAVTAAAMFTLSYAALNYGLFFICVAAIAFCFGGNITIFPAIVSDFFGLKNHSKNYGVIYQGFGIGALSGSFIAALLGGFKPTFIIIGLLCILACLIAVSLKAPGQRRARDKGMSLKPSRHTA